jgi:hypothetical protein
VRAARLCLIAFLRFALVRVYLDQNAWIALLQAKEGHPRGARYRDTLLLLKEAVRRGDVSLPLSYVHYVETSRRRPYAKRARLARLMAELSRYQTIAPFQSLVRAELRVALASWFGSRIVPDPPAPFGRGADHAFGIGFIEAQVVSLIGRHGERARPARGVLEWGALAGHPDHDAANDPPGRQLQALLTKEAERLEKLRSLRRPDGWTRGDKSRRAWSAQAYVEALDEVNDAFDEADVPAGALLSCGREAMSAFLKDVPTLAARYELGRLKEQDSSATWTVNDLRDLEALSVAVVYADVVVTENMWTALAGRARLDAEHRTRLLNDVTLLPSLFLQAAS